MMKYFICVCFILISLPAFSQPEPGNAELSEMSRAELSDLYFDGIMERKIVERLEQGHILDQSNLPRKVQGFLIRKYMECYPPKSYFRSSENRFHDYAESRQVPIDLKLIDKRYLIDGGFRQHEADVKSFVLFDLKEKEAVISLLNYTKDDVKPFVDIYVSQTASSETVSKGVELVRDWIEDYMTTNPKYSKFINFPPFTLYTSTCSD